MKFSTGVSQTAGSDRWAARRAVLTPSDLPISSGTPSSWSSTGVTSSQTQSSIVGCVKSGDSCDHQWR
jgi:hypothetical protein